MNKLVFSKVIFGADHAGFNLKEILLEKLIQKKEEFELDAIIDYGTYNSDEKKDYPVYAQAVSNAIVDAKDSCGILVCSTGIGMSIAANRFKHVRAALCSSVEYAKLAREHNDANILVLSQLMLEHDYAIEIMYNFLQTKFIENERYLKRINMMD